MLLKVTTTPRIRMIHSHFEWFSPNIDNKSIRPIGINLICKSSIPKERTEKITAEQIKNAKVELKDIDTSKEFSLKAGKTTYNTFKEAETAGVIAGDETNGYYVDLTKVPAGSDLEISYHEK